MTATADSTPHGRVYLITNSANGKCYVGQTVQPIATRFRQHCQLQAKCRALEAAIRKYGAECFTIAELAAATTQDELNELEARYVHELSTIAPTGYNLREGGGAKGAMHPETKKIMSQLARSTERRAQLEEMRSRPDIQRRMTIARKNRWPAVAEKMQQAGQTPEARKKRSASLLAHYSQPEAQDRIKAIRAESNARPEVREQRRKQLEARWAAMTPEQREAEGLKISKSLIGHKKKIDYSPEAKAHRKEIAVKRWQDPKNRAALLAANSDPEVVKKRGDAIRAGWALRRDRIAAEKAASN